MAYKRKTVDAFEIQGNYGYGWEMVTWEETRREAIQTLRDYNDNEPKYQHRIRKVREKIKP